MAAPKKNKWQDTPLTAQYLIDSGLLFEVNRTYFHPLGISLAVKDSALIIQDHRQLPSTIVFTEDVMTKGVQKLRNFMDEFGNSQMDVRRKNLGWSVQPAAQATSRRKSL